MTILRTALTLLPALALATACRSNQPPPEVDRSAMAGEGSAEGSAAAAPAAEAEGMMVRGPLPDAPCPALVEFAWQDFERALVDLRVADPAALRARFDRDIENSEFVARCESLSTEEKECIWSAANVLTGIATCGVNTAREFEQRLLPPNLSFYTRQAREPLSDEAQAAALQRLEGEWQLANGSETWSVSADGTATVRRPRGTEMQEIAMRFEFVGPRALSQTNTENNRGQIGPIVFDGDDAFYASMNAAFGVYDFDDGGVSVVDAESEWLIVDATSESPSCEAIGPFGERIEDVTCGFDAEGMFVASYTTPGDIRGGGDGDERERRYRRLGDQLVHQHMRRYERAGSGDAE